MNEVVNTKLKKFEENEDFKSIDYPLYWQYLTSHINTIINNLELFKKVKDKKCTDEEKILWYKTFYHVSTTNNKKTIIDLTQAEIERDYCIFKEYALNEINKCRSYLFIKLDDTRHAMYSLNLTLKRVNELTKEEENKN